MCVFVCGIAGYTPCCSGRGTECSASEESLCVLAALLDWERYDACVCVCVCIRECLSSMSVDGEMDLKARRCICNPHIPKKVHTPP